MDSFVFRRMDGKLWLLAVFYFILQLYCSIGISAMENSGCFRRGKPATTELRYPTYGACWVLLCFHNLPNSDMDYKIFNMRTDVNACDCTRGCTDTVRESALKVDSGKKIPCRTGELNLPQWCAFNCATSPPHRRVQEGK